MTQSSFFSPLWIAARLKGARNDKKEHMNPKTLFDDDNNEQTTHNVVNVLVPFPVEKAYSYIVPESLNINIGDYVVVPFKGRDVKGVVWSGGDDSSSKKLKTVLHKFDVPPLPQEHRKFIEWTARYTVSPLGSVLKMTLNTPKALEPEKPSIGYVIADDTLRETSS